MMFDLDEYFSEDFLEEFGDQYDDAYADEFLNHNRHVYMGDDDCFEFNQPHRGSTSTFKLRRSVSPHPTPVIIKSPQTQALDCFQSDSEDSYDEEELLFYLDKSMEIKDKSLKEQVKKGDNEAAFQIGQKYSALRSMNKAIAWYKLAASSHHSQAQIAIGDHYNTKLETEDIYTAIEWYTKAYQNQNKEAAFKIGLMYKKLEKTSENQTLAMEWLLKSFTAGNGRAALEIGKMYMNGHGVPKNELMAMEWYLKADEAGDDVATKYIGDIYSKDMGVKKSRLMAFDWYKKAYERGNIDAAYTIGKLYQDGKFEHVKGPKEALQWFYRAAIHDHDLATAAIIDLKNKGYRLSTKNIASIILERDTDVMKKKYKDEIKALKMELQSKDKQIGSLNNQLVGQK